MLDDSAFNHKAIGSGIMALIYLSLYMWILFCMVTLISLWWETVLCLQLTLQRSSSFKDFMKPKPSAPVVSSEATLDESVRAVVC